MTFTLDMKTAKEEFNSDFKPYAPDGVHEATLKNVTKKVAGTGTIFFEFNFEDSDDYQYPKVSRAFFRDEKQKFRAYHYAQIMIALGAAEAAAEKAVNTCENKANREAISDAYVQMFDRLAQKHPKIKIEVSPEVAANGKTYARGEFADPAIHFGNNKNQAPAKAADVLPDEVEVEGADINLDDSIPF